MFPTNHLPSTRGRVYKTIGLTNSNNSQLNTGVGGKYITSGFEVMKSFTRINFCLSNIFINKFYSSMSHRVTKLYLPQEYFLPLDPCLYIYLSSGICLLPSLVPLYGSSLRFPTVVRWSSIPCPYLVRRRVGSLSC